MGPRHRGRELALRALYQLDIRGNELEASDLAEFLKNSEPDATIRAFAAHLVEGVRRQGEQLDRHIAETLEHWQLSRLSPVDHNVLRLALYELLWMGDIPARVTLDEAIELAKRYGDRDSGRFVNGVLDRIAGRLGCKDKGDTREPDKAD